MTTQDAIFFSALVTIAMIIAYWWGTKEKKSNPLLPIKIGKGGKIDMPSIKDILSDLTAEPEVDKEEPLKEEFSERFKDIRDRQSMVSKMRKQIDRDSDDLWEDIRKDYNVSDSNLKVDDDLTKLIFLKPSKIEKTVAALMKRM